MHHVYCLCGESISPKWRSLFTLASDTDWMDGLEQVTWSFLGLNFFFIPYNDRVVVHQWFLRFFASLKLPLWHSGNLKNLPLHVFYHMPLKGCPVSISPDSSSEGLRNAEESVVWFECLACAKNTVGCSVLPLPNWCWAEWEKLPCKTPSFFVPYSEPWMSITFRSH